MGGVFGGGFASSPGGGASAAALAALQSQLAKMPRHYATIPDVEHADSDEFNVGNTLNPRWTLCRTDTWATVASAGDVDPLTNPAANTVRMSVNPAAAPSWLLVQPALGLQFAIKRRIAARPSVAQFRCRMKQIVPGAAALSDTYVTFHIGAEVTGNPDLSQNYAQAAYIVSAAQTEIARTHFRGAGALLQMWDSQNHDGNPHDCEFIIRFNGGDSTIYMNSNTGFHALSHTSTGIIAAGQPCYVVAAFFSANTATSLIGGFAPIFAFDYFRQRDDAIVLPVS